MKLCIQNVIDCLNRNGFVFSCDVKTKEALYSEVSIYTDGGYQDDILYVCNLPHVNREKNSVYIVSKAGDLIAIRDVEAHHVHNVLLGLFDYVNQMETRLLQALFENSKLADIGNIIDEYFRGPSILWYLDGYPRPLVAYYQDDCCPAWKALVESPDDPQVTLSSMTGGKISVPEQEESLIFSLEGYGTQAIYCPIKRSERTASALMILEHDLKFLPGDVYILECFAEILKQHMMLKREVFFYSSYLSQFVRSLLSGTNMILARENVIRQYDLWAMTDQLVLLAATPFVSYDPVETGTLEILNKLPLPKTAFLVDRNRNILLLASRTYYKNEEVLCAALSEAVRVPIKIGISTPFSSIYDVREQYKAALKAVTYCNADSPIAHVSEIIVPELRKHLIADAPMIPYIHPALRILHAYDKRDNTTLAETLRVFVFHECNYSEASKALHISRNTLIKQISIIQSLTAFDFNNFDEYRAVLYSFLLYADVNPY